jgi:hypothetical protein
MQRMLYKLKLTDDQGLRYIHDRIVQFLFPIAQTPASYVSEHVGEAFLPFAILAFKPPPSQGILEENYLGGQQPATLGPPSFPPSQGISISPIQARIAPSSDLPVPTWASGARKTKPQIPILLPFRPLTTQAPTFFTFA